MKKLLLTIALILGFLPAAFAQGEAAVEKSPQADATEMKADAAEMKADDASMPTATRIESGVDNLIGETDKDAEALDIKETIFEHLGDRYGWELPFNHHKSIPLPIIVWGTDGLHIFSSSRLEHGQRYTDGNATFKISNDGENKGKIVEIVKGTRKAGNMIVPTETEVVPFDFSITKNVCAIFIACIVVLILMLRLAAWHKHNPFKAPRKVRGAMEALVEFIYKGVIVATLKQKAPKFAPYLLTVFFFIFFMNLLGLIVVFPGGANVTGNIAVTMVLALFTFFITNVFATKVYWKEIFWPDVPLFLKFPLPIMQVIEVFGLFTKPAALTVRLFANMMGGHMIVLILTLLIFIFADMGAAVIGTTTLVSVIFSVFMLLIDCLVSFIQAYVFTMLSTIFIAMAQAEHEEHKEHKKEHQITSSPTIFLKK